jgi:hypothetical protein
MQIIKIKTGNKLLKPNGKAYIATIAFELEKEECQCEEGHHYSLNYLAYDGGLRVNIENMVTEQLFGVLETFCLIEESTNEYISL